MNNTPANTTKSLAGILHSVGAILAIGRNDDVSTGNQQTHVIGSEVRKKRSVVLLQTLISHLPGTW